MIPINLAIIGAGAQAGSRRRGFLLGATYGGAMVAGLRRAGPDRHSGGRTFGHINASPWFNAGIAALFVLLALAMFDVVEIDFSRFSSRFAVATTARGTFLLAFTLVALAHSLGVLASAPVVIQSSLFASNSTRPHHHRPRAGRFCSAWEWRSRGRSREQIAALPKPGRMVRVKQVFGVFILVHPRFTTVMSRTIVREPFSSRPPMSSPRRGKAQGGWYSNLAAGLAAAEREQSRCSSTCGQTWCKSCLTMDKTTLRIRGDSGARHYVKIKFQAENPDESPARECHAAFRRPSDFPPT